MTAGGIPLRDLHRVWHELWPLLEPANADCAAKRAGADAAATVPAPALARKAFRFS